MRSFTITTTSDVIKADDAGRAKAAYTVTNATTRPLRGLPMLKALGATKHEWLSIAGDAERDFAAGATETFTINFEASGAPAGKYPFRLDVASAVNPDEEFAEGATITVEVAGKAGPPPIKKAFPIWIIFVVLGVVLVLGIILLLWWRSHRSVDTVENAPVETPSETPVPSPSPLQRTNVAVDKTARQSSLYAPGAPGRAIDGNRSGNWLENSITHTQSERNAWWEVDLGAEYSIARVAIWNRTDCCAERLSDFYVLVSEKPFTSNDLNETINNPGVASFRAPTQAGTPTNIPVGRRGRYVRIQLVGTNYLSLAEVEVFADVGG